jgi:hypothetical protein
LARFCIKFQRHSNENSGGTSAVGGLLVYLSDFVFQNLMNALLAYYLHSQHFINASTKNAFCYFSVVYYVLTFVPPFISMIKCRK